MSGDDLVVTRDGPVLTVLFNRPDQRNALTWPMYDGLVSVCDQVAQDKSIRVVVLRGAGERAFASGTDIRQFADFRTGADGVAYEHRVTNVLHRIEDLDVPTVAAIRGVCAGAGLLIAAACDLRIATRSATFGAPIARTVGNCLSIVSFALLAHHLGAARVLDVLLRGKFMSAEAAYAAGFVAELCADEAFDETVAATVNDLVLGAPLTQWAAKEARRRLRRTPLPDGDDIVDRVYGSADFHEGVQAFVAGRRPQWTGQ